MLRHLRSWLIPSASLFSRRKLKTSISYAAEAGSVPLSVSGVSRRRTLGDCTLVGLRQDLRAKEVADPLHGSHTVGACTEVSSHGQAPGSSSSRSSQVTHPSRF